MSETHYEIGMVGLGVMGRNLVLNMADHGHSVAGLDKDPKQVKALRDEAAGKKVDATGDARAFVAMLRSPRAIMMLVPAGPIVDAVIGELLPLLSPEDLIVDAGNSHFIDTDRRAKALAERKVHFFGMGVSGGESGARHGPSMMPGGPQQAYERVRKILEDVSAKVGGDPCVTYLGPGSAGHYVKMVHNGIEYGLMQLIAETYDIMRRGLGMSDDQLHAVYDQWDKAELNSFLMEITAQIFLQVDKQTGKRLVDVILDVARQKGTGKWTSQSSMDLVTPIPTIDAAVAMRDLSGFESDRLAASKLLSGPPTEFKGNRDELLSQLRRAMYAATIITYAQGMALLRTASQTYNYNLNPEAVARIWRGGCIIRATLLEDIRKAYKARADLPNLLLDKSLAGAVVERQADLRAIVRTAAELGIPTAAFSASLAYYDGYRTAHLPANLIQAQRDFFGAHTYERVDEKGTFHTQWGQA